jgi:hypothetical protein
MAKKYSVSNFNIADYDETHTFQLAYPAINNSLSTKEGNPILFPPSVTISSVDRILYPNEETGMFEERTIAYRPGYTSVFVSEGEDFQSLNENRSKSLGDIEFVHGFLRVNNRQPQLLEFLRLCNKNGTNVNRDKNTTVSFFEVNHEAAIKSIMDNEERDIEIITFCTKGEYEAVRSVAKSLGVNVNQPVIQVRYDLRTAAMRNEETKATFMRALNSPAVKRKSTVLDAIENQIVFVNRASNSLTWGNGSVITTAPMGKDPVDYFVDNSFNNSTGEMTFAEIENQLDDLMNPHEKLEVDNDKADITAFNIDPYGTILRLGKVSGLLEQKGGYVKFHNESYRKTEFIKMLKSNSDLFNDLKSKLLPKEAYSN